MGSHPDPVRTGTEPSVDHFGRLVAGEHSLRRTSDHAPCPPGLHPAPASRQTTHVQLRWAPAPRPDPRRPQPLPRALQEGKRFRLDVTKAVEIFDFRRVYKILSSGERILGALPRALVPGVGGDAREGSQGLIFVGVSVCLPPSPQSAPRRPWPGPARLGARGASDGVHAPALPGDVCGAQPLRPAPPPAQSLPHQCPGAPPVRTPADCVFL